MKASFQRIWEAGTENIPSAIIQDRLTSKEIKFFGKAMNCAGLQLCDMIAHPSFRSMRRARDGDPELDDFGGRVAGILVAHKLARNPKTQEITGWGRKWLP